MEEKINRDTRSALCAIHKRMARPFSVRLGDPAPRKTLEFVSPSASQCGDLHDLSDEELIKAVTAGHHDALTVLFDRYHRLVFSVAFRIVRDPGEAEEVVQTVSLACSPEMFRYRLTHPR
jgi:hypothetical protein